jgi:hypothetical protein
LIAYYAGQELVQAKQPGSLEPQRRSSSRFPELLTTFEWLLVPVQGIACCMRTLLRPVLFWQSSINSRPQAQTVSNSARRNISAHFIPAPVGCLFRAVQNSIGLPLMDSKVAVRVKFRIAFGPSRSARSAKMVLCHLWPDFRSHFEEGC